MAVRDDFSAGEVLAAADLNDTFASKLPYSYGTATPSTSVDGFLWYDSNSTPPDVKFWDGAAFQALTSGKILQVVRATDATNRQTTSNNFADVSGMSVTITPQKSDSAILIIASYLAARTSNYLITQITDASNNAISGSERRQFGANTANNEFASQTILAYATPATTSATTYKLRFRSDLDSAVVNIRNDLNTGQMIAIEVSA